MEINGKKLDDERVAAARESFERRSASYAINRKGKLTFDDFLERFTNDCVSFKAIAQEDCTSRQNVTQKYEAHFREWLPGRKRPRQRMNICTLKRLKALECDFSGADIPPWVRDIIMAARANGCIVRRSRYAGGRLASGVSVKSFKKGEIFVNSKRCELHLARAAHPVGPHSEQCYSKFLIQGSTGCLFVIMRQEIGEGRTFIIPIEDLRKKCGDRRQFKIYIPVKKISGRHRDASDWFQYENAWHLLK